MLMIFDIFPTIADYSPKKNDSLDKFASDIVKYGKKGYYSSSMGMFFEGGHYDKPIILPKGEIAPNTDFLYNGIIYPCHIEILINNYRNSLNYACREKIAHQMDRG